ncbi:HEPN domain-containing protein [Bifidobacterium callimiconis]|uniref:ApeA N-terminal domain-containing protein n=1 Tax=Bifidobacterium callimiconis TaxID=2306973 RepID=A0A430FHQ5_9BIFI|nr:HEPN domain-containing protein [Bifidobacterium callimiconis]RSX52435.1 hypothetical protein D2E23_0163 [Bifidobacterium callimiconis]
MTNMPDLSKPMIGWLVLKDKDTADTAMLYDTGERFELSIPFSSLKEGRGKWFNRGVFPLKEDEESQIPYSMRFIYNNETFILIDCHYAGMTSSFSFGLGPGTGKIVPTYVVYGGRTDEYDQINGMRTNCADMVQWFNLPSTECRSTLNDVGRCESVDVHSEVKDPLPIDKEVGLYVRPTFNVTMSPMKNAVISRQNVDIETNIDDVEEWSKHLEIHREVLDLISITSWMSEGFTDMTVICKSDPIKTEAGTVIDDRWAPVFSYKPLIDRKGNEYCPKNFLFDFSDIGSEGIRTWRKLNTDCGQGMSVLRHLDQNHEHMAIETLTMLAGMALECVGWYIVQSEQQTERMKKRSGKQQAGPYSKMLDAIIEKFEDNFPFIDADKWKMDMRNTYMGDKHPDAQSSDFQTMYEVTMEGMIILRLWVGLQLGASIGQMRERLNNDKIGKSIRYLLKE